MPDLVNPVGAIGGALGNAAASVAADVLDAAGEKVWNFAATLLTGAFAMIDRYGSPDVDPRTGPMAGVWPVTLWVGGAALLLLAFLQLGKAMAAGGKGLAVLVIGLAQYAVITAGGLGFLAVLVAASDGLATGLLAAGAHVDSFGALSKQNAVWQDAGQTAGGIAMGLIALICVVPAAFGLLIEALVRHAATLVLAATMPILAAGLVMEATARWFWTGLRWMFALLLLTPAIALVTVIGLQAAAGSVAAIGTTNPAAATVGVAVGGVTLLVAMLCPLVLFKLLAFLDPNTVSGGAVRGFFSGTGAGSSDGPSPAAAASSGGSDSGESATESRFGSTLSAGMGAAGRTADTASERGGQILDTAGVGHFGVAAGNGQSNGRAGSSGAGSNADVPASGEPEGAPPPPEGSPETPPQGPAPSPADPPPPPPSSPTPPLPTPQPPAPSGTGWPDGPTPRPSPATSGPTGEAAETSGTAAEVEVLAL